MHDSRIKQLQASRSVNFGSTLFISQKSFGRIVCFHVLGDHEYTLTYPSKPFLKHKAEKSCVHENDKIRCVVVHIVYSIQDCVCQHPCVAPFTIHRVLAPQKRPDMFGDRYVRGLPVGGILTTLASFMSLLMLGAFYTFGNLMPYLVSYMRNATGEDITYAYVRLNQSCSFYDNMDGCDINLCSTVCPKVPYIFQVKVPLFSAISACILNPFGLMIALTLRK